MTVALASLVNAPQCLGSDELRTVENRTDGESWLICLVGEAQPDPRRATLRVSGSRAPSAHGNRPAGGLFRMSSWGGRNASGRGFERELRGMGGGLGGLELAGPLQGAKTPRVTELRRMLGSLALCLVQAGCWSQSSGPTPLAPLASPPAVDPPAASLSLAPPAQLSKSSTVEREPVPPPEAELPPPSPKSEQAVGAVPDQDPVAARPHRFLEPLVTVPDAPANRYANLSPSACRAKVQQMKLPVKRDRRPTPGVATALRFTGPLNGIDFLTAGWKSPYGVMDCRLVLAFEAMTKILADHDVSQVHVGTIYRRNSKLGSNKLSQHAHALAADIVAFKLSDGRLLNIEQDFAGELGTPVCGPESQVASESDEGVALRNLICDMARHGLFHYMLTPNYNQAHHDHLHVDIKRNAVRTVLR